MTTHRDEEEKPFKVSVSCLADFVSSGRHAAESLLRPYKFNRRGEGFARSSYYRACIAAVRSYHANGNDPNAFEIALQELRHKADTTQEVWERTKCEKNIDAIEAYRRIYKDRKFRIMPNHRLAYRIGKIIVTAQPDLWVEENGAQVLLKIGIARKQSSYVDILLTVIRKAAISSNYRVRARNVVYLNVTTGREMICRSGLKHFNRTFRAIAREIAQVWPTVTQHPINNAAAAPAPA